MVAAASVMQVAAGKLPLPPSSARTGCHAVVGVVAVGAGAVGADAVGEAAGAAVGGQDSFVQTGRVL